MALIQFTLTVNSDGTITAVPTAQQILSLDPGDRVQFVESSGKPVVVNAGDTITYLVAKELEGPFLATASITNAAPGDEVQVTLCGANDPSGDGSEEGNGS